MHTIQVFAGDLADWTYYIKVLYETKLGIYMKSSGTNKNDTVATHPTTELICEPKTQGNGPFFIKGTFTTLSTFSW